MSKFITNLPTEVSTLLEALPKGSYIHGIVLSPESHDVHVLWENNKFETGLTIPIQFDFDDLKKNVLPKHVNDLIKSKMATKILPNPEPVKVENSSSPAPRYMTKKEVEYALKNGKDVEFMGVLPVWKPFAKDDAYIDGYFYRLKI